MLEDLVKGAQAAGANVEIHASEGREEKLAATAKTAIKQAYEDGQKEAFLNFLRPLAKPLWQGAKNIFGAGKNLFRNPAVKSVGQDLAVQTAANNLMTPKQPPPQPQMIR